jgi:2,5-furandicarboxylate decarboxylase 1
MQKGLREFLTILDKNGELWRIKDSVSPLDASAIIAKSKRAVMMPVKGYDIPLVGGIVRDRHKMALSLNCEPKDVSGLVIKALQNPIEPIVVKEAPCQEVI